jgi:hypothetical protein
MADFDFNALPPEEQANLANMYRLNQAQSALASPGYQPDMSGYEFKKPENFGQAVGNVVKNRVLNPLQETLGYREPIGDIVKKMQIGKFQQEMSQNRVEALSAAQLRNVLINGKKLDPRMVNSLDYKTLQSIVEKSQGPVQTDVYGNTYTVNTLTGERTAGTAAPTSVQEYKYGVSQIPETVSPFKPAPVPSYFERQDKRTAGAQSTPSAVQTLEYMRRMDPSINDLPGNEQVDLLMKIIRLDPATAGATALAQEKARNGGLSLTPAEKVVDEAFGKHIIDWRVAGGQTTAVERLKEFSQIIETLNGTKEGITGRAIALVPRKLRSDVSQNTQDRVEKIITEGLRQTLGAQFTENEAAAFISRSYNVVLPHSVNAARLQRVRDGMAKAAKVMSEAGNYYDEKGTLQGYQQPLSSIASMEQGLYWVSDYRSLSDAELIERMNDPLVSDEEFNVMEKVGRMRKVQ